MSIRCFYYSYNFDSLQTSFEVSRIANASNHIVPFGEYIIVCASQNPGQQLYGFLAQSEGIEDKVTAKKYWPNFHRPHSRVTRVKILSRLTKIPLHLVGSMTRAGIRNSYRNEVMMFLRSKPVEIKQDLRPVVIQSLNLNLVSDIFIFSVIDGGYKIGVTTNLERRMKQLEVPAKATIVGQWESRDYTVIERLLHKMYTKYRVPQSEWFLITREKLQPALDLLNESTKLLTDINLQQSSKTIIDRPAAIKNFLNSPLASALAIFIAMTGLGCIAFSSTYTSSNYNNPSTSVY